MSSTPSAAGRAEPARLRILVAGAAVAGFLVLRRVLAPWGVAGTAVAEWVAMVGMPVALLAGWGVRPGVLLRVGPRPGGSPGEGPGATAARRWTATFLVGSAGIPVAWFVTWLQGEWLPPDPTVVDGLQRQLLATDGPGLLLLLAAAVLTPAICEELVFRGAFLGALLRRWPTRTATSYSGAVL